jgi:hypothetical protein
MMESEKRDKGRQEKMHHRQNKRSASAFMAYLKGGSQDE